MNTNDFDSIDDQSQDPIDQPENTIDFGSIPNNPDELHEWIIDHLGVRVVRTSMIEDHSAPFEYLCHAFFEHEIPRDSIVWANRGGGKTFYAALATMLDMIFKPGIEIRILGGSLEQSKRMHTHLRSFFEIEPFDELVQGKITERRIKLINGSSAELLAQSQTSVRGTRVQKLRCDEVELFDREVWEAAQLVTREKHCGDIRVKGTIESFSTLHVPYGLMHDLVTQSIENNQESRRVFRWGVLDVLEQCDDDHECLSDDGPCPLIGECAGLAKSRSNDDESPSGHISIDDAIALKSRVGLETWQSEMLCLRPQRSDCVIPEFDQGIHVIDQLPMDRSRWTWIGGMDFGIRSPTVVLQAGVDESNCVWVSHEYLKSDTSLDAHIDQIRRFPKKMDWIGVDPAGRQRGFQTGISDVQALRKSGLTIHDRKLGLHDGLNLIRARLQPASGPIKLYIHRSCAQLIESLEQYHYPAHQPMCDSPEKDGSDHCVDALRYMIQNLDKSFQTRCESYIYQGR